MGCIRSRKQTIDTALENEMGDRAELEGRKKTLEGWDMHMLLQQGWESAQRALEIAEELAQRPGWVMRRKRKAVVKSSEDTAVKWIIISSCGNWQNYIGGKTL